MFKYAITSEPVEIHAPIDTVWDILADVDRYCEWNPFARTYHADRRACGLFCRLRRQTGPLRPEADRTVRGSRATDPPVMEHEDRKRVAAESAAGTATRKTERDPLLVLQHGYARGPVGAAGHPAVRPGHAPRIRRCRPGAEADGRGKTAPGVTDPQRAGWKSVSACSHGSSAAREHRACPGEAVYCNACRTGKDPLHRRMLAVAREENERERITYF